MPTSSTEKEMHKSPTLLPVQKEEELLFYEIKKYIPETDHRRILTAFPERKLQKLSKQVNTPIHTILKLETPEKKNWRNRRFRRYQIRYPWEESDQDEIAGEETPMACVVGFVLGHEHMKRVLYIL